MKITRAFIESNKTVSGGWTRLQFSALGIIWPPRHGWIERVVSKEYTAEAVDLFVQYGKIKLTKKQRKRVLRSASIVAKRTVKHPSIRSGSKQPSNFAVSPSSPEFLLSYQWRKVRMEALKKYGARCMCCGATPETGAVMNVDHIKPRLIFPMLALDINNLQILCHECNHGKGNWDMTDWRDSQSAIFPVTY